jgi:uncharacterized phage-associated protein
MRRHGREDRHGRDNRRIEDADRQGPFWTGWGQSARRRVNEGGTVSDRQKGGGAPLGIMPYKTKAIANAILNKAAECGEKLRPLKLQKLLYYACGYYYAAYREPLIDSAIEAWDYGPVVPEVYREFRRFGSGEITDQATELDWDTGECLPVPIPTDQRVAGLIDFVWNTYGKYSGLQLSDMTHSDGSPWQKTRERFPGIKNADISNELMSEHFAKYVKKKAS